MELKRDLVKYVRDKAKSKYDKGTECYICKSTQNLDFHHFHGLTELLEIWLRKNKIKITGEEDILNLREQFIAEHTIEIYDAAVTLCHEHHMKLHSIYGKRPRVVTALKQERWVSIQRDKYGMV